MSKSNENENNRFIKTHVSIDLDNTSVLSANRKFTLLCHAISYIKMYKVEDCCNKTGNSLNIFNPMQKRLLRGRCINSS